MMNNQSELTVEKPRSSISPSVVEIRGAYLELNSSQTRVQRGACISVWKLQMRSSRFESRVSIAIKSRISMAIESRVSTTIKSRVSTTIESCVSTIIESRVSNSLKFTSPLDQHDDCVYKGCFLSHTKSMSLLLQSVQQYTCKSDRQLHWFNSTPINKAELMTIVRLSF